MSRTTLDYKGLQCPLPVLKANKQIKSLGSGDEIEVLATDPSAPADFETYCETTGHTLVESSEADGVYSIVVRKA